MMTLIKFLRRFMRKKSVPQVRPVEYVHEYDVSHVDRAEPHPRASLSDIDFSHKGDLEAYVDTLTVRREDIEHWMTAGLLLPQEMKVAEKITRMMRKREQNPAR